LCVFVEQFQKKKRKKQANEERRKRKRNPPPEGKKKPNTAFTESGLTAGAIKTAHRLHFTPFDRAITTKEGKNSRWAFVSLTLCAVMVRSG